MAYPRATTSDIEFFRSHGWLVVEDAVDPNDLQNLMARCDEILANRSTMAFDWAWEKGVPRDARSFKIVQASPTRHWPEFDDAPFRSWAIEFGSALLGGALEFWYDQFLAKPPHNETPTAWHQDEAYWGRNLDERGVTCWMPFHDVGVEMGCMHFIDEGHRLGILTHRQPENMQSDLLSCRPDESRAVACPLKLGSVTFHLGKTPHMTTANETNTWRKALTQHLKVVGTEGEGDHYPWKVYVNQFSGKRVVPPSS